MSKTFGSSTIGVSVIPHDAVYQHWQQFTRSSSSSNRNCALFGSFGQHDGDVGWFSKELKLLWSMRGEVYKLNAHSLDTLLPWCNLRQQTFMVFTHK